MPGEPGEAGGVALCLMAHPDDAELLCAGTLLRLHGELGWRIHLATMTPGDCGSAELPADEIARIRRGEAQAAAALVDGTYHCLEERDLLVFYHQPALAKVTRLFRQVRPRLVITHSPSDYMLDHEMTSVLARAAAFGAPIPNFLAEPGLAPLGQIPHLYYADPIEGRDFLGNAVEPAFSIDISGVIHRKQEMLCCHASQREWLLKHHGVDEYVDAMRSWAGERGRRCGVAFAEGFRQHRGHGYPHDNLLGDLLGDLAPPTNSAGNSLR